MHWCLIETRQNEERLQNLDAKTAAHVERVVREVLALTETPRLPTTPADAKAVGSLLELAAIAEPMGALTNDDIDRAIYGR